MKKYNVGIVGYGWVATAHIPAINATPLGQVTAVCSSRKLDAAALSAQYGGRISVYNDLDEMLANPDIHVVSLCGFPTQRLDQVVRAARAGKHLILEKPLCLSLKELRAMHKAVKQARVKTCVCFECRYSSQFQVTKAILDRGLLGHVHYGEVDYYHGIGPWYAAVPLVPAQGRGRQLAARSRLPRHGRPAALPGQRGRRGHELRHQVQEQALRAVRVSEHERDDPQVQERRRGQVHVLD